MCILLSGRIWVMRILNENIKGKYWKLFLHIINIFCAFLSSFNSAYSSHSCVSCVRKDIKKPSKTYSLKFELFLFFYFSSCYRKPLLIVVFVVFMIENCWNSILWKFSHRINSNFQRLTFFLFAKQCKIIH